jgi:hypothetical protein
MPHGHHANSSAPSPEEKLRRALRHGDRPIDAVSILLRDERLLSDERTAAARKSVTHMFDPIADQILFFPHLVGG